MVVALTVTPALCSLLPPRPEADREWATLVAMRARYDRLLRRILAAPRRTFVAAAVLTIIGAVAWPMARRFAAAAAARARSW